jgi:hypothetical protein
VIASGRSSRCPCDLRVSMRDIIHSAMEYYGA